MAVAALSGCEKSQARRHKRLRRVAEWGRRGSSAAGRRQLMCRRARAPAHGHTMFTPAAQPQAA